MDLFRFIPGYRGVIFDEGKEPLFLLLVAFLIAFGATRGYTRLARKRGWGSASFGGVHLHHCVVGIIFRARRRPRGLHARGHRCGGA